MLLTLVFPALIPREIRALSLGQLTRYVYAANEWLAARQQAARQ